MQVFYQTKKGVKIYKPSWFHIHESIDDSILIDALSSNEQCIDKAYIVSENVEITYNVGYSIGYSMCIECPIGIPNIFFKVREPRQYQSRMIHGALPRETSNVTIILKQYKDSYNLVTAWAGNPSKPELGNISYFERCKNPILEIEKSAEFWTNHALIDEHPTIDELIIDMKIICQRLGSSIESLDSVKLSSIISARLGKTIKLPSFEHITETDLKTHLITINEQQNS